MQTVVAAVIAFLLLPNDLESARFLTPSEKEHAIGRVRGPDRGTGNPEK
jgi:hypothetical protein